MDEMIYDALGRYYHALEMKGYLSDTNVFKLLVLIFYRDFLLRDYNGYVTKKDYRLIERALDCIYGTTCLIPYPDYLSVGRKQDGSGLMLQSVAGRMNIGEISEMGHRLRNLEETDVLKLLELSDAENPDAPSDIMVVTEG